MHDLKPHESKNKIIAEESKHKAERKSVAVITRQATIANHVKCKKVSVSALIVVEVKEL